MQTIPNDQPVFNLWSWYSFYVKYTLKHFSSISYTVSYYIIISPTADELSLKVMLQNVGTQQNYQYLSKLARFENKFICTFKFKWSSLASRKYELRERARWMKSSAFRSCQLRCHVFCEESFSDPSITFVLPKLKYLNFCPHCFSKSLI